MTSIKAKHFLWHLDDEGVAVVTLNRPEKKNPLTFDSYAELRDTFRALVYERSVKAVVICGADENFCSGGDVNEIIGPLTKMDMQDLLAFTRMTGDLVKAIRHCPQPVIAAIDGVCAGAGAAVAMACDLRYGTARSKTAFLFTRVGLAGADRLQEYWYQSLKGAVVELLEKNPEGPVVLGGFSLGGAAAARIFAGLS